MFMFLLFNIEKVNICISIEFYYLYGVRIFVLKWVDNEKEIGWFFNIVDLEEFF